VGFNDTSLWTAIYLYKFTTDQHRCDPPLLIWVQILFHDGKLLIDYDL
jgi:hypothetical protein